jgi:lipoate-protein ligase A
MQAKGVESVRSRVVNLIELNPAITVDTLKAAMTQAFSEVYDLPLCPPPVVDEARIEELTAHYASDAWLFGQKLPFTFRCEQRFSWGGIELQIRADRGVITDAKVYTDAMDDGLADKLKASLTGCSLQRGAIAQALRGSDVARDKQADLIELIGSAL